MEVIIKTEGNDFININFNFFNKFQKPVQNEDYIEFVTLQNSHFSYWPFCTKSTFLNSTFTYKGLLTFVCN